MSAGIGGDWAHGRYEAALGAAFAALAFLSKDNPQLVLPECLWLFLLLLGSSLAASLAVRRRPGLSLAAGLSVSASFAVVLAIQSFSGGSESELWVLHLLPIFSAAIFLGCRETAWIAGGALLSNAAYLFVGERVVGPADAFAFALKTSILAGAAAAAWSLAKSEREAGARAESQREEIERLETVALAAAGGAGAVHDLGAPLTVILGYAAMRRGDRSLPPAARDDMARIERSAKYCQNLVRELLSRRGQSMSPRPASEVAESAMRLCEDHLRARKVKISLDYIPDSLLVRAAGLDLERVLVNLIGNAAKALPAGGRIVVAACLAGARVLISVDDDGPGIAPELQSRLFTPFATGGGKEGGVGLGLYLCRAIARRHGGDLSAGRSRLGGARFELALPLAADAKQSSEFVHADVMGGRPSAGV